MHSPSTNEDKIYTGTFKHIRLAFTPEPPLPVEQWSQRSANYPTELADIHVFLDGEEATQRVPSGYLQSILHVCLMAVPTLVAGGTEIVEWLSDPWQFDLRGEPKHNRVFISLHVPGRWKRIWNASVPLDMFGDEVIRLSHEWERYLLTLFREEMLDLVKGKDYRRFKQQQAAARQALDAYRRR